LGRATTMQGSFYQKVFSREGIDLLVPDPTDQDYIHNKYFQQLVPGEFLTSESRSSVQPESHVDVALCFHPTMMQATRRESEVEILREPVR